MGVRDHQPSASQATLYCFAEACGYERAQKLTPEALGLAVAHGVGEAFSEGVSQHLALAEGIDADCHHHCPGDHLQVAAQAAVEVGGVEVDIGEMGMIQRPAYKGLDLLIWALADTAHFRFGDVAVAAQRLHQGVDFAGGDAAGAGLHDDGIEGLVDPAARFEPVWEEAAMAQLPQAEDLRSRGMARVRTPTWVASSRLR